MPLVILSKRDVNNRDITFTLDGELDIKTAQELRESIEKLYHSEPANIIIDMKNLGFIDSTGLGMLVSLRKKLSNSNVLSVLNPPKTRGKSFSYYWVS